MSKRYEYETTRGCITYDPEKRRMGFLPDPPMPEGDGWRLHSSVITETHGFDQYVCWFWEREVGE